MPETARPVQASLPATGEGGRGRPPPGRRERRARLLAAAPGLCYNRFTGPGGSASASRGTREGRTPQLGTAGKDMKKGVPVSPGVAVAYAFCVDQVLARHEPYHIDN